LEATDRPPPLPKWTRRIRFEQVMPDKNCFRQYRDVERGVFQHAVPFLRQIIEVQSAPSEASY
jgi:hypothetical protein